MNGDLLVELCHVLFDLFLSLCGHGDFLAVGVIRLLLDQIDQTNCLLALENREGERNDRSAEHLAQAVEDVEEVRMLLVELGDIEHCGKTGFCEVLPALFGADADAALRGQADQTRVGNAQGLHDLTGKVEVAGVIENVDLALVIFHRNDRRRDGILALLLFVVEVGNGRAVRALAQTGDRFGRKEHALAQRGLAVAAVTQQADVANVIGSIAHSQIFSFLQPDRV